MIVACPKCHQLGTFGWLGEPDREAIVALVSHVVGAKLILNPFTGKDEPIEQTKRCFLTLKDIEDLPWFEVWKVEKERLDKEYAKKMDKEFETKSLEYLKEDLL